MVDDEYWGFKGEAWATGHILEHYAMDEREPKSMKGLEYMNNNNNNNNNNYYYYYYYYYYLGAQVHGMKGLYRCMQVFEFDY